MPSFPLCYNLDLNDYFNLEHQTPLYFLITIRQVSGVGIWLVVEDRLKSVSKRPLKTLEESFKGYPLWIKNLNQEKYVSNLFKISQTIYSTRDANNPCVIYPTNQYKSYDDCDQDYVLDTLKKTTPGLKPFWAVRNLNDTTKHSVLHNFTYVGYGGTENLFDGTETSDCRNPCLQTLVQHFETFTIAV